MPFECRKSMLWGPGRDPVRLLDGDEVPSPVKKVLLDTKYVVEVDEVRGKLWADQPVDAQKAWAEANGQNFLIEKKTDGSEKTVPSKLHLSRLVEAKEVLPSKPLESQEAEVAVTDSGADLPPPLVAKKKKKVVAKKRRGRPPKKMG